MAIQKDGYQTLISFSLSNSGVLMSDLMEEMTTTPPGVDGGGPIDQTSMRNELYRTMAPKSLKTLLESTVSVKYDPAIYDEILATVNQNQAITITFPDASTIVFWGWINTFVPNGNSEGNLPLADMSVEPSNLDADDAEIAPAFSAAP